MNILEEFPNATAKQKEQLQKAQKEWENAIDAKGEKPNKTIRGDVVVLECGKPSRFKDITDAYIKKINEIMNI